MGFRIADLKKQFGFGISDCEFKKHEGQVPVEKISDFILSLDLFNDFVYYKSKKTYDSEHQKNDSMKRPFVIKELATKNYFKKSKNELEMVITTTNNELERRIEIVGWKMDQIYRKLSIFKDETDQTLNKIINSLDGLARLISDGRIEYDYVFWKRENEAIRPS